MAEGEYYIWASVDSCVWHMLFIIAGATEAHLPARHRAQQLPRENDCGELFPWHTGYGGVSITTKLGITLCENSGITRQNLHSAPV